jgi:Co/Zn/Cd efflux system component
VDAAVELQSTAHGDDVDGNIVLWFASVGILFDIASLSSYLICGRHHTPMHDNPFFVSESSLGEGEISELVKGEEGKRVSEADASSQSSSSSKSLQLVTGSSQDEKGTESPSSPRVKPHIGANMRSALLHLISDSMRSITTLV